MRLLLIEDDRHVVSFIKKGLESEGYQLDVAYDGAQGLEMGLRPVYDLIVLDLILPERSGMEVCLHLRENHVQVPILMLTARDSVEDKVEGLGVGADDYLTKPFAFAELVARIQALLRRPASVELGPALQFSDLTLDPTVHEVKRAGQTIELTPKEFTLLEYLMRHSDRVLSRSMIEEHVWGYGHDSLTNVVDVYVHRLRQKIDSGHAHPLIHTIRGIGYQIKA
jgi:DNA-binding response OmpR family regulator